MTHRSGALTPVPKSVMNGLHLRRATSSTVPHRYLAWFALCPIQRRPLLGLTEVWVVGVAAPQLLAGLKGPELWGRGWGDREKGRHGGRWDPGC